MRSPRERVWYRIREEGLGTMPWEARITRLEDKDPAIIFMELMRVGGK